jgi:hypothetical protein
VPELDFPTFPKLGEYEITEDGQKVEVDEIYFRKLLIFRIEYNSLVSEYKDKKELYEKGEKENEL